MVGTWCMCCVYKASCFANKIIVDSMRVSLPRLVAKQTCRNRALSLGIWDESLSMMIGRAGGWVEWSGAVKVGLGLGLGLGFGLGLGLGFGLGLGEGAGEGEGRGGRGKGRGVVSVPF